MISKYPFLAFKNLRRRKIRSWLTILGIFIGIVSVVALVSLGNAMEEAISKQFVGELSPDKITIIGRGMMGFGGGTFSEDDISIINSIRGVESVIPRYTTFAEIEYREDTGYSIISNIPEGFLKLNHFYESYGFNIEEGRLINSGDTGVILIGNKATESRLFKTKIEVGDNLRIEEENFRVVGILSSTGNSQKDRTIFLPQYEMERVFNLKEDYPSLDVKVLHRDEVEEIAGLIREEMRNDRKQKPGEEDFEIQTSVESAETVSKIINTIRIFVLGIAFISLFVGGVGITNTMYMSILERRKEIGIMKSVGAKNKDILALFLTESGLLGLIGGITGSFFGLLLAFVTTYFIKGFIPGANLNVTFSIPLLIGVILFSFLVGTISGILPAMQASKLTPVEALRK